MDGQTWNCAATDEESFSRFETNDEGFMSGAKLFGANKRFFSFSTTTNLIEHER